LDTDDSDEPEVIEDGNRRRKVSAGLRNAHVATITVAQPDFNSISTPGRGRGGGLRGQPESTIGLLPPITETADEGEEAKGATTTDKDQTGIMAESTPPEAPTKDKPVTKFTFRAQLTWGLARGTRVNLPQLFREWVSKSGAMIPDFVLLPFDDDKGQPITKPEQVPDDNPSFYQEYYYIHRTLNHGNFTGMVHFSCSVSWNKIKRMKEPFFRWLHRSKIYLNMTKFKCATLVVCGFLVGAHPGHFRREDAEK
jgi:hypothetical protein